MLQTRNNSFCLSTQKKLFIIAIIEKRLNFSITSFKIFVEGRRHYWVMKRSKLDID